MIKTTASRSLLSAFVLPLLASCGLLQSKPQPIPPRTEVLTVETPAYKPQPHELTGPIMPPPRPPAYCTSEKGEPLICAVDGLVTIPSYQSALDLCNKDRVRSELLGATDGEQ